MPDLRCRASEIDEERTRALEPEGDPLFIISGPSGAGKSTAMKAALHDLPLTHLRTYTTRPPRPFERANSTYVHLTGQEFHEREARGEFIETVTKYGYRYGSPRSLVAPRTGPSIVELDINGIRSLRRVLATPAVSILVTAPSPEDLHERLTHRDGSVSESRSNDWNLSMTSASDYDYVLVNRNVTTLGRQVVSIITSELVRFSGVTWIGAQAKLLPSQAVADPAALPVASAVVVKAGILNDGRVLMLKASRGAHGAKRDLPGGQVRLGEDPVAALQREVREETGLEIDVLGPVRQWSFIEGRTQFFGITWACRATADHVVLSSEHDAYEWIEPHHLPLDAPERAEMLAVVHTIESGHFLPIMATSRSILSDVDAD
ncbi:MAG: NUDIX domain-containing protein [Actinomycetota bacterium]